MEYNKNYNDKLANIIKDISYDEFSTVVHYIVDKFMESHGSATKYNVQSGGCWPIIIQVVRTLIIGAFQSKAVRKMGSSSKPSTTKKWKSPIPKRKPTKIQSYKPMSPKMPTKIPTSTQTNISHPSNSLNMTNIAELATAATGIASIASSSTNQSYQHDTIPKKPLPDLPAPNYQAPTPAPNYQAPTPSPNYQAPTPAPNYQAPTPAPNYQAPTPAPNYQAPTPITNEMQSPDYQAPLPPPKYEAPLPPPKYEAPLPPPKYEAPSPIPKHKAPIPESIMQDKLNSVNQDGGDFNNIEYEFKEMLYNLDYNEFSELLQNITNIYKEYH